MSTLLLVRHAQASFMEREYDRLSPLGEEQARRLGAYWARTGVVIDEVWSGPRVRQLRTCELAGEAFTQGGGTWPAPRPQPALDEYPAHLVMEHAVPQLSQSDAEVRALAGAFMQASERRERGRHFEKLFQAITHRWVTGTIDVPGLETWPEFCARVHGGVRALTGAGTSGRRVVAFTSAGAIGVSMQAVLGAGVNAAAALELGWVVKNASLTEYLFSAGRVTLSSFNAIPHLDEPAMWTYR